MNQGIKTVLFPVSDLTKSQAIYNQLLGAELYMDQPSSLKEKVTA